MATKLQCEICGGKLVGKPGGIFECEFCGTEFSTEWAKAKIQEIQGIVRVEGTVEVKGSVQIEGSANVQSLIRRGNLTLEDGKWDECKGFGYIGEGMLPDSTQWSDSFTKADYEKLRGEIESGKRSVSADTESMPATGKVTVTEVKIK